MNKRNFMVLVALVFTLNLANSAKADEIGLAWNPSPDADVTGYILYHGTASGNYSYTNYIANVTNATITGLQRGLTYYFVVTATNTIGLESPPSNELVGAIAQFDSFDDSFVASGLALNPGLGLVSGNISALPADPKSVFWAKSGLNVTPGQILTLGGRMYYNGADGPVSVYLVDEATGFWLSPERVIYPDYSYGYYQASLIVFGSSRNAKLCISCGHRTGLYQFQRISIWLTSGAVTPITDLYLRQLLPKQSVGLYSAEWFWNPVPGSEGYVVRATPFRDEIEKGAAGIILTTQTLPPNQTSFKRDIDATLYGGIYLAVSSLVGGQESTPWITWYMPGDIYNTADEDIPPLCFQGGVDAVDVNYAYTGYTTARRVPALTSGQPAGREERTDIDNNTYAGRVSDYPFIRSQYLNGRRMQ